MEEGSAIRPPCSLEEDSGNSTDCYEGRTGPPLFVNVQGTSSTQSLWPDQRGEKATTVQSIHLHGHSHLSAVPSGAVEYPDFLQLKNMSGNKISNLRPLAALMNDGKEGNRQGYSIHCLSLIASASTIPTLLPWLFVVLRLTSSQLKVANITSACPQLILNT